MSAMAVSAIPVGAQGVALSGTMPQPLPLFPSDNWWNLDVSQAPLDANSANFITYIGTNRQLHPDWGGSAGDPDDRSRSTASPTSWCRAASRSCR